MCRYGNEETRKATCMTDDGLYLPRDPITTIIITTIIMTNIVMRIIIMMVISR